MWEPLEAVPGLWAAEKRSRAGWHWRAFAVRRDDGRALVIGPFPSHDDEIYTRLETAVGAPAVALAPNHFHWLALPAWRQRYPELPLAASDVAARRLRKKLKLDLADLDVARQGLPAGMTLVEPPGLETGEVWLRIERDGRVAWVTTDAFFNLEENARGVTGFMLRLTGTAPGLRIGRTFTMLHTRDQKRYRAWLLEQIAADRPTILIPGHGAVLVADDLPERLEALARARL